MNEGFARFLKKKGINSNALAQKIGASSSAVLAYTKDTKIPHTILVQIADLYNTTCDEVLGRSTPTTPSMPKQTYDISAEHAQLNTAYKALRNMYEERVKELAAAREKLTALQKETASYAERSATHDEVLELRRQLLEYSVTISAVQALLERKIGDNQVK